MSDTLSLQRSCFTPKLSGREKETLYLIAHEFRNKEIAQLLFLSTCTIDSHRKSLLAKLGVSNSAGLIRRAYELGHLPMEAPKCIQETTENVDIYRIGIRSIAS